MSGIQYGPKNNLDLYLGEMTRINAEQMCHKYASFRLYHRYPSQPIENLEQLPSKLPLFVVYRTSHGIYWWVFTRIYTNLIKFFQVIIRFCAVWWTTKWSLALGLQASRGFRAWKIWSIHIVTTLSIASRMDRQTRFLGGCSRRRRSRSTTTNSHSNVSRLSLTFLNIYCM